MKEIDKLRTQADVIALGLLFLSMPLVAVIASKLIFWCAILAVFLVLSKSEWSNIPLSSDLRYSGAALLGLVIWGGLSWFWSIDPWHSLLATARLSIFIAAFFALSHSALCLSEKERALIRLLICAGGWLGIIAGLVVVVGTYGYTIWSGEGEFLEDRLNHFNRTGAILLILFWGALATTQQKYGRSISIPFLCMTGILCFLVPSSALFLAFLLGLCVFGLAHFSLTLSKALLLFAFLFYVVLMPVVTLIGPSIIAMTTELLANPIPQIHRIEVWQFCLEKIAQYPLLGFGFDTSHKIPGGETQVLLYVAPDGSATSGPLMPLHPHSAPLQVCLELGIPGLCLLALLFRLAIRGIPSNMDRRSESRAAVATVASGFTLAVLSFDIWQGWWLCALFSAVLCNTAIIARASPTKSN
jgi:O-antigen ligase